MRITALIMAGGYGERLWPLSRKKVPKQFVRFPHSDRTLIQQTADRIKDIVDIEDIYVVTGKEYSALIASQLPKLQQENIIIEPDKKNTAPCIGLGIHYITKKVDDPVILVIPSDHFIENEEAYRQVIMRACESADKGLGIYTIGIEPNHPDTGFGYIKCDYNSNRYDAVKADGFTEKPDYMTAEQYVKQGNYLWNSGIFIFKASVMIDAYKQYLPDIYDTMNTIEVNPDSYLLLDSISIDYGILEKIQNIYVYVGNFIWDDAGSWESLLRISHSDNCISDNVISIDNHNCIIESSDKTIVAAGMQDAVIVESDDVIFVYNKNSDIYMKDIITKVNKINDKLL